MESNLSCCVLEQTFRGGAFLSTFFTRGKGEKEGGSVEEVGETLLLLYSTATSEIPAELAVLAIRGWLWSLIFWGPP